METSGAMYSPVPIFDVRSPSPSSGLTGVAAPSVEPISVVCGGQHSTFGSPLCEGPTERPKSAILTFPDASKRMFDGFRSTAHQRRNENVMGAARLYGQSCSRQDERGRTEPA
jgi:hypothetical protein